MTSLGCSEGPPWWWDRPGATNATKCNSMPGCVYDLPTLACLEQVQLAVGDPTRLGYTRYNLAGHAPGMMHVFGRTGNSTDAVYDYRYTVESALASLAATAIRSDWFGTTPSAGGVAPGFGTAVAADPSTGQVVVGSPLSKLLPGQCAAPDAAQSGGCGGGSLGFGVALAMDLECLCPPNTSNATVRPPFPTTPHCLVPLANLMSPLARSGGSECSLIPTGGVTMPR
eukprot:COSAG05_NODE_465_length_9537_cov_21.527086_12_plen_227_part_00